MKFIDFFAGIGGFRRGMELAGMNVSGFANSINLQPQVTHQCICLLRNKENF